eukprot:928494-Prorocentrum_minimum.AAC.1
MSRSPASWRRAGREGDAAAMSSSSRPFSAGLAGSSEVSWRDPLRASCPSLLLSARSGVVKLFSARRSAALAASAAFS